MDKRLYTQALKYAHGMEMFIEAIYFDRSPKYGVS